MSQHYDETAYAEAREAVLGYSLEKLLGLIDDLFGRDDHVPHGEEVAVPEDSAMRHGKTYIWRASREMSDHT